MTAAAEHHVEPDGYCSTCGTVGCRARRVRTPGSSGVWLADEVRELRADLAVLASALGVALSVTCPSCAARHRPGEPCPSCGLAVESDAPE